MAKKELFCYDCETYYSVSTKSQDPVKFCPFCGAECEDEDSVSLDDDLDFQ